MAREVDRDTHPLVSVIIPVHNRLQYVGQAIRSVLHQTYPNTQIVMVDDGSEVDPAPALEPFGDRVKLIRKRNGGLASARNFGIKHALGEFLLFLDDDDELEPTALEVLLEALRGYPGGVWAAGRFAYIDEQGRRLNKEHPCHYDSGEIYAGMINANLIGAPSTVLVSSAIVRALGGFVEASCYHMAEDYDLWLSLAKDWPIAATRQVVTKYRLHSNNWSSKNSLLHAEAIIAVLEKQRGRSRPGLDSAFLRAIARTRTEYGIDLYQRGYGCQARAQWRQAMTVPGAVDPRTVLGLYAKSYIPASVHHRLRRMTGHGRATLNGASVPVWIHHRPNPDAIP